MPLHTTEELKAVPTSQIESESLDDSTQTYVFPDCARNSQAVYQTIHNQLILDGNSQQNLATFCTTWIEPEVKQLMDESADKNMIDKDEYPQTAAIEERCVHMLADLWNSPEAASTIGCSTTGSSEAAMLGGLALKWNWRKRRRAQAQPADTPNLVMGPVQVCWHKFCRYFDVEIREVPMEGDRLLLTPEEVLKRCDENTIGVIVTLGVTFTLQFEPVQEISLALDRLKAETGLDIPIHVDGASGAFLAPFTQPGLVWDFRLPRVKSINASGHKFGLAPLGVGWALWREKQDLPEELIFDSKLTTYAKLSELNRRGIQFITLRRRSKGLMQEIDRTPSSACTRRSGRGRGPSPTSGCWGRAEGRARSLRSSATITSRR